MEKKRQPATWLKRWCAPSDKSWERTGTRWKRCGELATDIDRRPESALPALGLTVPQGRASRIRLNGVSRATLALRNPASLRIASNCLAPACAPSEYRPPWDNAF